MCIGINDIIDGSDIVIRLCVWSGKLQIGWRMHGLPSEIVLRF
jgi:hypothetical protein